MSTLDQVPATSDPVHEILIGDSKTGKSTYAAQAAIDGFTLIYVDSDNGISALRNALRDYPEAQKRVHYFSVSKPVEFITKFLQSNANSPLVWNPKLNKVSGSMALGTEPEDELWWFDSTQIPKGWLLVIDSWTSVAADSLDIGDADAKAELLDGTNQGIYGTANSQLTFICNMLQKVPYHVLVQAHATEYEQYEKPTGQTSQTMKQKDMILREIKTVPLSCSRPHGETMVSRFNHIGWLTIDRLGRTDIDFTRTSTRVGGGPPNRKARIEELPFSKLVPSVPPIVECDSWHRTMTFEEYKAQKKPMVVAAKPATPATPATVAAAKPAFVMPTMVKK
jgi:hypothetical protein